MPKINLSNRCCLDNMAPIRCRIPIVSNGELA